MANAQGVAPSDQSGGPGASHVGPIWTIVAGLILGGSALMLLYVIGQLWSATIVSTGPSREVSAVPLWGWHVTMSPEYRNFLLVMASGSVGSLVHALRSFYWYVGERNLRWSWLAMYALLPVVGSTLGAIVYLLFRGGLISAGADADVTNEFGFAALAALVGLFSNAALLKLKDVAEVLFKAVPKGRDANPQ